MKWLTRKRIQRGILSVAILFLLAGLFIYVIHLRSRGPLENYKRQLREAGEKLTLAELIPPAVPAEQNSATFILQATGSSETWASVLMSNAPAAMQMISPGKAMVGWKEPVVRNGDTNSWNKADLLLEQLGAEVELLQGVVQRPAIDFGVAYRPDTNFFHVPHLAPAKNAARLLGVAVVVDLHHGEVSSAETNLHALLTFVKRWDGERLMLSQLVRLSMVSIACVATWEFLQAPGLTDPALAGLQADWAGLEFLQPAENALMMERAWGQEIIPQMKSAADPWAPIGMGSDPEPGGSSGSRFEGLSESAESFWDGIKSKASRILWRVSWSYTDELRALRGQQIVILALRQARTNGNFREALEALNREARILQKEMAGDPEWMGKIDRHNLRSIFSDTIVSPELFPRRVMATEVSRQLAIVAIALKRYELKHQSYPDDLSRLVPDFLAAVPKDPGDGKPVRYRRNADGSFVLYSVGDDGVDDGGDPTPVRNPRIMYWLSGRDWVWPQPAGAEEIQIYRNERATHKE